MNQGINFGSQIGRWIVLAALVAVLGALLLAIQPVRAQDSTTINFTENSTDAVLTLTAGDPEEATPITWSLPTGVDEADNCIPITGDPDGTGDLVADDAEDNCVFEIDPRSGVLEFKSPPDYDNPGDDGDDNVYNVVVQATDGDAGNNAAPGGIVADDVNIVNMVDDDDTRSWFKVIVNVRDINEDGSINLRPTAHAGATLLQPQIEVGITAHMLMDEDGSPADPGEPTFTGATYQWQRSSNMDGPWENITRPDTPAAEWTTYTPQQVVEGDDLGKYLRVVATYTEAGPGGRGAQRAIATSMYPTIQIVGDNDAPSFTEGLATTRPVREHSGGTNIGLPVAATNPESGAPHNEKLTYWLSEASTTAVTDALVLITQTQTLTPAPDPAVTATTNEQVDDLFSIDPATGQLMTKAGLNYEDQPYRAVTVHVADSSDNAPDPPVTTTVIIRVLQTNDNPTIEGASTIEHVEGETALDTDLGDATDADVATYDATDEDPTDTTLTFSLAGADKDLFKLRDTTAADAAGETPADTTRKVLEFKEKPDYENPTDANTDNVYEIAVKVFDGEATTTKDVTVKVTNKQEDGEVEVTPLQARIGIELNAALTDSDIVAYGPMWQWQKSNATCTDHTALTDDAAWNDIPGATSATFTPRSSDLGYCLRAEATYNDGYHEDTALVVDPSSPSSIGLYTASDTRFEKTADKSLSSVQYPTDPNIAPQFGSAMTKRFVLENAAVNNPVGKPVTATDGNGPDDALEYTLSGDTDAFGILPPTGQLTTKMKFDHESKDKKYTVTVTATDTHKAASSISVDIYVIDVDEKPVGNMRLEEGINFTENSTDAVLTLTAGDPEEATPITWSLPTGVDEADNCIPITGDPDGTGDLVADDAEDNCVFEIDPRSDVLEFKSPPDYDNPGDDGDDNVYNVVVQATDGDAGNNAAPGGIVADDVNIVNIVNMVDDDDTRSWFKVIVNVQDIDEDGSINLRPTAHAEATMLQPQIGVDITADMLMDEDGSPADPGEPTFTGATYQWQRSSNIDGPWDNITRPDTPAAEWTTYTPQQVVDGGERDLDKYLQVVATYTEAGPGGRGGQMAIATSMYPTIRTVGDNNIPSFTEGLATTRPVRENSGVTNIGIPVAATNPESGTPHNEKLTYWLSEASTTAVTDALVLITQTQTLTPAPDPAVTATTNEQVDDLFSIDPATGQLMTKAGLNYEDQPYRAVTVHVADSSDNAPDPPVTTTVIIRVLQTNDNPTIEGASTIEHVEGETALDTDLGDAADADVATYDATDEDPTDTTLTFSLAGADKDLFKLRDTTAADAAGETPADTTRKVLEFKEKPDYENPTDANTDNVYEIAVKVFDGEATTTKDVTVKVTNKQEDGEVEVTPLQARIGIELNAALTDSDIVAYGPMWQWQKSNATCTDHNAVLDSAWNDIPGATSATFTPRSSDLGYCLRAEATYNDGYHEDTAPVVDPSSPSSIGLYTASDTRFDKTADKSLSSVQYPTDPNIAPQFGSAMTKRFVLENAAVNNPVGKPVTATDGNGPDDALKYELSGDTDAFGILPTTGQLTTKMKFNHESEDKKYTVTVTATDTHNAAASIDVEIYVVDVDEMPQIFESGLVILGGSVEYDENDDDAVATYTASGSMADNAMWTLMGDDAGDFMLEPTTGKSSMLKFRNSPNYEMPMDADTDNQYMVTVKASDGTYTAMKEVTVTVTNVDELGTLSGDSSPSYEEGGEGAVGTYRASDGSMSGMATWTLLGDDMGDLSISTSGVLTFDATPNYEMPMDADTDNQYMVTVKAEAGGEMGEITVAVTVTNVDELGTLSGDSSHSYEEGGEGAVGTYRASDGSMSDMATWTLLGDDMGDLSISSSGVLTFDATPNYEMPMDADTDNQYMVTVKAEAGGEMGEITVAVTVTNVDELGTLSGDSSHSYEEGGEGAVGTYRASDGSMSDMATWTLLGDDMGDLSISSSGVLTFDATPNYEMPMDADTDNQYMVTVKAEAGGEMGEITVAVTVTNVDELGTLSGDSSHSYEEGGEGAVGTYRASDGSMSDMATWTLLGDDMGDLSISSSGVLTFDATPNYEMPMDADTDNQYMVTVKAEAGGEMAMQAVNVMVTNVEELGTLTADMVSPIEHPENSMDTVATYTASGPMAATATWTKMGDDAEYFTLTDGVLTFSSPPDYEMPRGRAMSDANTNSYMVTVKAEAGSEMAMQEVTINVTNVVELDGMLSGPESPISYMENGTMTVATYTASGPMAATATWTKMGDDAEYFTLTDGVLTFSSPPDYEMPRGRAMSDANTNSYMVTVKAEAGSEMAMQEVTVTVTDVDELGTLSGPESPISYMENGTMTVATYTASGPMAATATWTKMGDDAEYFTLTDGVLTFSSPPDFEAPADADTNNTYMVTVKAEAGGEMDTQDVTVTVTDVGELGMLEGTESIFYTENGTGAVGTYTTSGPDTATWSLEGADAEDFNISSGGELTFNTSPDFEAPADADTNNTYMVTVKAEAGGEMDTQDVTVTVTDVGELGMLEGMESISYAENGTDAVGTYTTSGSDTATWSLEGADAEDFNISSGGELTFNTSPDFEAPADADTNNTYMVTVKAEAGGEMDTQDVTVTVTDVGELGMLEGTESIFYAENGTDAVGTYTTSGPDTATWSLEGADAEDFNISSGGELTFNTSPDFEAPADADTNNTYMVTVKAEAGGEMDTQDVTVTVTDVGEIGMLEGTESISYAENVTMTVATYTVSGGDGSTIDWSLDGADASQFMLDGTGMDRMLKFKSAPDYEMPRGAAMSDTNTNTYMVTVKASAGGKMDMVGVTVTVTDVSELGTLTADMDSPISYMENGTMTVATYTVSGGDGSTVNWSLDGADSSQFTLEGTGMSRMLKFSSAPDYEAPADADGDNVYMVTVKAEAGGETDMVEATVTVTDVVEEVPVDLVDGYDTNDTEGIQIDELFDAIDDYFDGKIGIDELFEVIDAYFG